MNHLIFLGTVINYICPYEMFTLSCVSGKEIDILDVFFGRKIDSRICQGPFNLWNNNPSCDESPFATKLVKNSYVFFT